MSNEFTERVASKIDNKKSFSFSLVALRRAMSKSQGPVRFYPNEYPAEGDKVWVKVLTVNDTSATVQLLEYANHEGMIPYTEFTRLRIRSVGKIIKVGRMEAVQVLRIDKEKKYIDLSKKQVIPKEAKKCEERYHKARDVHSIVCHAADECKIPRQEAMEMVAYPLYQKFGCAWDQLKLALKKPEEVFAPLNISPNLVEKILEIAQHRLKDQPVKLRADLEITCFTTEGVDAIRDVLRLGKSVGEAQEPSIPVKVSVVAPPLYILRAETELKEEGLQRLCDAIEAMKKEMSARGGVVKQLEAPRVVGDDGEDEKEKDEDDSDEAEEED